MFKQVIAFVTTFLAAAHAQVSGVGRSTRYWDCCAPSCYWNANTNAITPLVGVFQDGSITASQDVDSGCTPKGKALVFTDPNQMPWVVNDQLSYGFAAVNIASLTEKHWCCSCFELTFTNGTAKGKKMIVQATNTGADLDEDHFDIMMPGGGVGIFNGCKAQFGAPEDGWGKRSGGVSTVEECELLPEQLKPDCKWRFGWFMNADNPSVSFKEVTCPAEIVAKSGCQVAPI